MRTPHVIVLVVAFLLFLVISLYFLYWFGIISFGVCSC